MRFIAGFPTEGDGDRLTPHSDATLHGVGPLNDPLPYATRFKDGQGEYRYGPGQLPPTAFKGDGLEWFRTAVTKLIISPILDWLGRRRK